jgi:hypothetical protein
MARVDAALRLLDRQLVDRDGRLAGKVDDLELTDPGGNLEQPVVTAILAGPGALAGRLHTPLGRWLQAVCIRLLAPGQQGPSRVPFHLVEEVGASIRLRVGVEELGTVTGEAWVQQLIGRIPGAGDAAQ